MLFEGCVPCAHRCWDLYSPSLCTHSLPLSLSGERGIVRRRRAEGKRKRGKEESVNVVIYMIVSYSASTRIWTIKPSRKNET